MTYETRAQVVPVESGIPWLGFVVYPTHCLVKARKGRLIALCNEGDKEVPKVADHVIRIPKTLDFLYPILAVIPLQLLAYHIAVLRGCDVDQPRNLAKSVTVE